MCFYVPMWLFFHHIGTIGKIGTHSFLNTLHVISLQKFFTSLVLITIINFVSAQTKFTLNGYVRDSLSGESIIGATITVNGEGKGVASNQYGFYSITLGEGKYVISISHVSY